MKIHQIALLLGIVAFEVHADSSTLDAAIGGGIGGAAGAAIGNEIGGRDGAIIGGALGGGVGAAISTDNEDQYFMPVGNPESNDVRYYDRREYDRSPAYRFCPPGQAKKGRC
jgi:hypothetical protein